jgi:hypothetical protein
LSCSFWIAIESQDGNEIYESNKIKGLKAWIEMKIMKEMKE